MAIYYNHELTETAALIYHRLLAEYDVDEIGAACAIWMQESSFYPKANEIIQTIKSRRQPPVSLESRSQQQWHIVMDAVRCRGYHAGPPAFDDPITAALVAYQFTWARLCELHSDQLQWEEKRWSEAFSLAAERSQEHLQISAPDDVVKLADKATKRMDDQVNTPAAGPLKSFKRTRQGGPVDIEKRLELLKRQAEELKARSAEKSGN